MAPATMTVREVLDQLRTTPRRLLELTSGLPPELLRTAPGPDEWSANDVLAHLRACSDRWGEAATRIIEEDHPRIRGTEPRIWITKTDYPDLEFAPSLRAFVRQRTRLLAILDPLKPDGWQRTGTLVGAGKPVLRTPYTYAERLARHERSHVKQVAKTVATFAGQV